MSGDFMCQGVRRVEEEENESVRVAGGNRATGMGTPNDETLHQCTPLRVETGHGIHQPARQLSSGAATRKNTGAFSNGRLASSHGLSVARSRMVRTGAALIPN